MTLEKDIPITVDGASSLYTDMDDLSYVKSAESSENNFENLSGRILTFNHADFPWRNISIQENDTPVYVADISAFTPNKPDIILHSRTENGPVVGQAHFRWSLSIKAGVGPNDVSMYWTNMKRGGVLHRNYTFEYRGRIYSLRRTHSTHNGVAPHQRAMFSHMKVVDEASKEVIAVYVSTLTVKKRRGTITFAQGVSPELEVLCIMGFAAWREKIARAGGRSSGGAGGWS
ncbi:hypothetical protein M409DRAFT_28739 [Zasmidium cellare ATCC 36951]|uniref:Uncharacterized protein n=1 Tax=Zasmidium cellare ATCC 36951 TaxID=1080233 RepID=A0A6A6C543_ZASCE|nr:uncharacterized protein M409DRAFT_28739 [Zasmidium cellare ATCC 36951]KAF2160859.1 hypothetical protein M409DRAFT_28739 [Zasmidium cellare ATCC 36951]